MTEKRSEPARDEPVWRVSRLDDEGNEFEVTAVSSRREAEAIVRTFEARGHEQTYWVVAPEP